MRRADAGSDRGFARRSRRDHPSPPWHRKCSLNPRPDRFFRLQEGGTTVLREIRLDDFTDTLPAVVTLLCIPLTFSIAEGLGLGVIALVIVALGAGRARSLPAFSYLLAGVFFLHMFGGLFF